jgi:hypothetical protein
MIIINNTANDDLLSSLEGVLPRCQTNGVVLAVELFVVSFDSYHVVTDRPFAYIQYKRASLRRSVVDLVNATTSTEHCQRHHRVRNIAVRVIVMMMRVMLFAVNDDDGMQGVP